MFQTGEIISYDQLAAEEKARVQRGMNFRLHPTHSVFLMSVRPNAPYADRIEDDGQTLIYEGHDVRSDQSTTPKQVDQSLFISPTKFSENGKFYQAARDFKEAKQPPERIRVYEKIRPSVWIYRGFFNLVDAWQESDGVRHVFKFRLELLTDMSKDAPRDIDLAHTRLIPSHVIQEVWKRDNGRCVICGDKTNLHLDHIIPFSKGGTSLKSENIRLLCAKHNLQKGDKIE